MSENTAQVLKWSSMQRRSDPHGDILIILFWEKVSDSKNYNYRKLSKYLHVGQISLALEMSI